MIILCLENHLVNMSSSAILLSQNTSPRYLTVFAYVNGFILVETVGQYNLKRHGLNTCTQILKVQYRIVCDHSKHTSSNFYRAIAVGAMTKMSSAYIMLLIYYKYYN